MSRSRLAAAVLAALFACGVVTAPAAVAAPPGCCSMK